MKAALCLAPRVTRGDFREMFDCGNKDLLPVNFVYRSICEDVQYERLQIIPYILIYSSEGGAFSTQNLRILAYRRSKGGNEQRLHDLYSVGFGGHIEEVVKGKVVYDIKSRDEVNTFYLTRDNLLDTVFRTVDQELEEEIGLTADIVTENRLVEAVNIVPAEDLPEAYVNEVAKVHQAVYVFIKARNLEDLLDKLDPDNREVEDLRIIEPGDGCGTIDKVEANLSDRYSFKLEEWSLDAIASLKTHWDT